MAMPTMFEPRGLAAAAAPNWLALLDTRRGGFAPDRRFETRPSDAAPQTHEIMAVQAEEEARRAVQEAFAAGFAQARAEGEERLAAERAAHERLRLSVTRLDEKMRRALAERLAETVAALCETALAPLALDGEALQRRCEAAARLLGEAPERLELHLHPDDISSLDPAFAAAWRIVPRIDLERGTLQIEGAEAGAVDGPAEWRAALEAALSC